MAGIKGQKWNKDRPTPKVKSSVSLRPDLFEKVKELSGEKRWTVSSTIEFIIEEWASGENI